MVGAPPYPAFFGGGDVPDWIERHLPPVPLDSAAEALPATVRTLVRLAIFLTDPDEVLLYGSRARGEARRDSDFDVALVGVRSEAGFSRLLHDAQHEAITLFQVEFVQVPEDGEELAREVEREGRRLYVRS